MPDLPYSIELHDSRISEIERNGNLAIIRFSHAYVHRDGKGYSQKLEISIDSASAETNSALFPEKVSDGKLKTKLGPYHNLLNLPLDTDGKVEMSIELISGEIIQIKGEGIRVLFLSEPVFLEDVS